MNLYWLQKTEIYNFTGRFQCFDSFMYFSLIAARILAHLADRYSGNKTKC